MPVTHHYPSKEELNAAIRQHFAFLVAEYGFSEITVRPERYPNPYSVLYGKASLQILIEGINYGGGTYLTLCFDRDVDGVPQFEFWLYWLTRIRRPDLLEPKFPDHRGQLLQLPLLASELKLVADDVLRGDFSVLPRVRKDIAFHREESQKAGRLYAFEHAEVRSQTAFKAGQFRKVVELLSPHRDLLNSSSKKRWEIALSRLE